MGEGKLAVDAIIGGPVTCAGRFVGNIAADCPSKTALWKRSAVEGRAWHVLKPCHVEFVPRGFAVEVANGVSAEVGLRCGLLSHIRCPVFRTLHLLRTM